ncbi:RrF2 family transcriptional regulator [Senegalimassilia anaerobia]|uniref:RrF2 family transcriptional regulator n=1 Tax=Senegalimassilia anaerobia TaxID=1473216 RepID=UPI0023F15DD2|nr:Rrf2 family transcriptional regulator [Senegalimassilia anaerobia]
MPSVPAWNIGQEIGTRETVHFKASVEYGMRAVLYLAEKGSICSSREVADEMSIPRDYLIQLAQLLRNAGIVHARPGKNGGYSLAKDASEISMLDIFNALQNDRLRAERKEAEDASDLLQNITAACSAVEREMEEYMSSITLQNMIERIHGKESDTASGSTRSQTPA